MANTHFTGPVFSANGFVGAITGAVVGTTTGWKELPATIPEAGGE